ncbi:hypothetical protein D3C81_1828300 [compost metagenome]|uniref:Uncharacterized protein n=1 Tax=Serratia fonticola TaxID=47917 RepID=A0A4U9UEB5_SERFO|nr:Uncharacterised protein [Serratia fonticola]
MGMPAAGDAEQGIAVGQAAMGKGQQHLILLLGQFNSDFRRAGFPCFCPGKAHQARWQNAGDMTHLSDFTSTGFVFCRWFFILPGQIGVAKQ